MATCRDCGEEIEFRYIDGVKTPIHQFGGSGCNRAQGGAGQQSALERSTGKSCYRTNCPQCGDEVYFVRYNGGCAWVDPPLGSPWPKHGCFADEHPAPEHRTASWTSSRTRSEFEESPDDAGPPSVPIMVSGEEHSASSIALLSRFFRHPRVKVWGIFNNRAELVAYVAYKHKAVATEYARRWSRELNSEHFVKLRDLLLRG